MSSSMSKSKEDLNICANLTTLYTESGSLVERFEFARKSGFRACEVLFPYYKHELSEVVEAKEKSGLDVVLINAFPGNTKGDLGIAAIPGREKEFDFSLELTFKYAEALKCNKIHIMSGLVRDEDRELCLTTLESNLRKMIPLLEQHNTMAVIEAINPKSVPNYFLNDGDMALNLVKKIDHPRIRLQFDVFHIQHLHGNLTKRLAEAMPFIGHIQIAQVPYRNEPDSEGEINYDYFFSLLAKLNYEHWIGLEYNPLGKTEDGLNWVQKYGCRL